MKDEKKVDSNKARLIREIEGNRSAVWMLTKKEEILRYLRGGDD